MTYIGYDVSDESWVSDDVVALITLIQRNVL